MAVQTQQTTLSPARRWMPRFGDGRNLLGLIFMVPAGVILLLFLTYPLGLGLWLGLTDTNIGGTRRFVRLAHFRSLLHDSVFWLGVFTTIPFTPHARPTKFPLGLLLSLLLYHPP